MLGLGGWPGARGGGAGCSGWRWWHWWAWSPTLGTTACNPLYNYYNHGPVPNPATPSGTYTVTVTAQSSNGVTAITNQHHDGADGHRRYLKYTACMTRRHSLPAEVYALVEQTPATVLLRGGQTELLRNR